MSHWIHWCWWRFEGLDPGHHHPHHFWRDLRGVTVKQFLQRFKSDSVTFTAPSRSDRSYVRGPDLLSQALYSLLLETNAIPQMPSRKICLPALCDITPFPPRHHRVWPFGTATITFCNFFATWHIIWTSLLPVHLGLKCLMMVRIANSNFASWWAIAHLKLKEFRDNEYPNKDDTHLWPLHQNEGVVSAYASFVLMHNHHTASAMFLGYTLHHYTSTICNLFVMSFVVKRPDLTMTLGPMCICVCFFFFFSPWDVIICISLCSESC